MSLPWVVTATIFVLQSFGSAGIGRGGFLPNAATTVARLELNAGVVLNVSLRQPLVRFIPVVVREQVDDDVHRRLLVFVERLIFVREQRHRIIHADHRFRLRIQGHGRADEEQTYKCESHHGYYT